VRVVRIEKKKNKLFEGYEGDMTTIQTPEFIPIIHPFLRSITSPYFLKVTAMLEMPTSYEHHVAATRELENIHLSEARSTSTHDLALTHELGVELGTIKREVNVKINAVKCTLGRVHAFEVLFQVLAAKVGRESDNFLDAYNKVLVLWSHRVDKGITYGDLWCTRGKHRRRKHKECPRT
jgi:hypothetical protein